MKNAAMRVLYAIIFVQWCAFGLSVLLWFVSGTSWGFLEVYWPVSLAVNGVVAFGVVTLLLAELMWED